MSSLHCARWTATRLTQRDTDYADVSAVVPVARPMDQLMRSPPTRWRGRGGRIVRLALPFDDIMEIALALLSLSPAELETLGWSFADRKRLLDHFLASGTTAQRADRDTLGETRFELRLPLRDIRRLRTFVHRGLPKAASNAALLDRLGRVLEAVS